MPVDWNDPDTAVVAAGVIVGPGWLPVGGSWQYGSATGNLVEHVRQQVEAEQRMYDGAFQASQAAAATLEHYWRLASNDLMSTLDGAVSVLRDVAERAGEALSHARLTRYTARHEAGPFSPDGRDELLATWQVAGVDDRLANRHVAALSAFVGARDAWFEHVRDVLGGFLDQDGNPVGPVS